MKKLFCLILVCFVFSSCAAPPPPLAYQRGLALAVFDVTLGGEKFTLALHPADGAIEVVSPECIAGVKIVRKTAGFSLVADGEEMELPYELLALSDPLFDLFSLSEANVEYDKKLDKCIIKTENGEYTVALSPDGCPSSISFEGARDFTATNIALKY